MEEAGHEKISMNRNSCHNVPTLINVRGGWKLTVQRS